MSETKNAAPKSSEIVELLKEVSLELSFLHGLVATDRPDIIKMPDDLSFRIDEKELGDKVDAMIKRLSCSDNRLS